MQLDWPPWQKNNREFIASLPVIFTPSCFLREAWIPIPHLKSHGLLVRHRVGSWALSWFLGWGSALTREIFAHLCPRQRMMPETSFSLLLQVQRAPGAAPAPLASVPNHPKWTASMCSLLHTTFPFPSTQTPCAPMSQCCTWAKPLQGVQEPISDLNPTCLGRRKGKKSTFMPKVGDSQILVLFMRGKGEVAGDFSPFPRPCCKQPDCYDSSVIKM